MFIAAIAILSAGLMIFFVSLPLVYRKVPMNSMYGIRIPAAFESEQRWYDINAYGGRQLAAWAWLIIAAGVAGFFLPEDDSSIYVPVSTIVVFAAILIPLVRIGQWTCRLPQGASQTSPMSSGEIVRATKAAPASSLLKKRTLIPASVSGLLCVAYVIFIGHSAQWLPPRVATHFGASGQPNGWMSREFYLHYIIIFGVAIAAIIGGVGLAAAIVQPSLSSCVVGSPTARNRNLSYLGGDILWFACLVLCFIAGTHYLTIAANRTYPAHLPSPGLAILIAGFAFGNIAWAALLIFHLMKKPAL